MNMVDGRLWIIVWQPCFRVYVTSVQSQSFFPGTRTLPFYGRTRGVGFSGNQSL